MTFQEGETVYLEDSNGKRTFLKVMYGMVKVPSLGAIDGSRLRDLDDGDRFTVVGREFTVFRPGALELMESLDRGAQIISPKDAATIVMHCDVKCGDRVIEVGAGSGGLTTALLHAVCTATSSAGTGSSRSAPVRAGSPPPSSTRSPPTAASARSR